MKKVNLPPKGSSYSSEFMRKTGAPNSGSGISQLSHFRKSALHDSVDTNHMTKAGSVVASANIRKNAQMLSSAFGAGTNTAKQVPEIYSPLLLTSNLNLPRDRATINAWCRAFFALNPFVHNAISLHSTYPISKLSIKCSNAKASKFFNDMVEELDLINICVQIAQEFWLLGEAFPYAEYNPNKGKWSRIILQNPDYMSVARSIGDPIIMLKPDQHLQNIVRSNKPSDLEQRKQLDPYVIDCVRRGENIPLNNFNISHLAMKTSPYEHRGTGITVTVFRQLALFDKLRESKFAQADNMINPLTLVKIGTDGTEGLHPSHADLEMWRELFENAQYDKDFKIFTHAGVSVERVGHGSGIFDISGDISQLIKEIYVGLMVPSVLMDGGSDTTYANGGVALDVLRQRYMTFRDILSHWLKTKIFAPIAKIQEFYEYKEGPNGPEKHLIVPEVEWNHMSLFDTSDYISQLVTLTASNGEEIPRVALDTLYHSLGLQYEDEMRKIRKQYKDFAIIEKEKIAYNAMTLNELRSLNDDDEVKEPEKPLQQDGKSSPDEGLPGVS